MMQTTTTIGAGTLLVFQPATDADEIALPVALGIQRFWARQLREAGRPAVYFVYVVMLERLCDAQGADVTSDEVAVGDKFVMPFAGFGDDAEVAPIVVSSGARWGLCSRFSLMGPRFRLEVRLVEVDGDGLRVLEQRQVEDDNLELPRILVEVVASAAQRTGVRPPSQHWSGPFTTADEHAALHYLKAEGVRLSVRDAFEPVVAALTASPTMSRAIGTARVLVRDLGQRGVPDLALTRQLRRLSDVGVHVDDPDQS